MKKYRIIVTSNNGKKTISKIMTEERASKYSDSLAMERAKRISSGDNDVFSYEIQEVTK
jgi:hypothetical protein